MSKRPATLADFCCGCGGLSLGLEQAGWNVTWACDVDTTAAEWYARNLGLRCLQRDIRHLRIHEWGDLGRKCTLWAAGLPCQPFSSLGKRLGSDDPRDLWPTLLAGIEVGHPAWVLLENVPGIRYWHDPAEDLRRLGYRAWERVLLSSHFGVPQRRRRWWCVATLTEADYRWPNPTHSGDPWRPAIHLPATPTPNDVASVPTRQLITVTASEARASRASPTCASRGYRKVAEAIGRPLAVDEAAALQCFPRHWSWPTAKAPAMRLIGNAVPPPVAEAIGRAILSALRGPDGPSDALDVPSLAVGRPSGARLPIQRASSGLPQLAQ